MDATPFYKLARLLPVALVCFLTIAPALKAKDSSRVEVTESNASVGSVAETNSTPSPYTQSASGTLVIVTTAKPESDAEKSNTTRAGSRNWQHPAVRRRGGQFVVAFDQSIQLASNQEIIAAPQRSKKTPTRQVRQRVTKLESAESIAEMLVYAHGLSQHASTETEYEEIAVTCDTAERLGVGGEQLEFALQLHAWAIKHRDQIRVDRMQQQLRAEKASQQLRARQAEEKLQVQRAKQQLRAEKAEQELRAVKIQQQLRAEVAEQQIRAERAEQQLLIERAQLELANDSFEESTPELAEADSAAGTPELIRVDPNKMPAAQSQRWQQLHDRGVQFAEQGKHAEALDDFNRVIELNPMYAKAYANRATLFARSGDLERAQADYQQACTLDPKLLHAQLGLGRVYHLLGSKEAALDCFDQASKLDPDNADIICSRADLLADMGRYRDALANYAQTIDLNPKFAHAYRNGSWLLATCPDSRFRDPANAVRGAQRALDLGYGKRYVALDTLAAAQASAGDFDQATETLQEAIKIAPHEERYVYRSRLQRYQAHQPFYTEPVGDVSQAVFEVSDRQFLH